MRVWIEEWHVGDRGSPMRVGDRVGFPLTKRGGPFIPGEILGEVAGDGIDWTMADGYEDDVQYVDGVITAITEVTARYEGPCGGRIRLGTAATQHVEKADGLRGHLIPT